MSSNLPAITGQELIKLLKKDGWVEGRYAKHGRIMTKKFANNRTRVTFIPTKPGSLPRGTLMKILGSQQTNLRKKGLLKLLEN